ncbi:uracil phosphoribosyltransferase [Desulfoscipio geothermicus]|uniref:Uracil phosphoribosyltransferase n=1 Tax=Desulfoscipio geothermicus DSM 3669 TaxID=1121426 RepID=A0A1I6DYH3_9FIRM|nr:uracil phosphoribosyltransferase [Desulfoscipio geothermicus]SFR10476.1 uracil phosphoribosyltransferase [Desulfoscipio geothermicus DSM 3669]
MSSVCVVDHPVAGNCLRILRDRRTETEGFRKEMKRLGWLLAIEATRDIEYAMDAVVTPLDVQVNCPRIKDDRILLVPILRAGLGFVDSFLDIFPAAKVAHVGVSRDHDTLEAITYLDTVPDNPAAFDRVFVVDPMLATGNSSVKTLEVITGKGYRPEQITLVCALAVNRGIEQVHGKFPAVKIVTAVIDPELNEKAYIVPGLGDAGDRLNLI